MDEDDFDDSQSFKRSPCPFPSTPFSTTNRAQSAAVYIIYTYDVLNIFMFVFTAKAHSISIPYLGDVTKSGILVELVIQFLQVIMIGVKFYPILVVADAEPHVIIYLFSSIYMTLIWSSWFFKKAFCSRTEAFLKQAFRKISTDLSERIKYSLGLKKNVTNTFIGLFTDEEKPSEKYLTALKEKIPSVFKEFFGKYQEDPSGTMTNEELLLYGGLNNIPYETSTLINYYIEEGTTTNAPALLTSLTSTTTTSPYGFRSMLKNKTWSQFKSLKEFYYQRDEDFMRLVTVFENLPLYLTLSYLLVRYSMLFVSSFIGFFMEKSFKDSSNPDMSEDTKFDDGALQHIRDYAIKSDKIDNEDLKSKYKKAFEEYDNILHSLDRGYYEKNYITKSINKRENHNYSYIRKLFAEFDLFGNAAEKNKEMSLGRRIQTSFIWNFIETKIYKNVPYMRYSKQFVNTYTVALMVIYFFTLFGFKLSNLFGNALVGTIELVYKFIFRGLIPSIDLNEHNFNAEFRTCCLLTSIVMIYQIFQGIRTFHNDLQRLHKGEKFFRSLILRYKEDEYQKIIKKRNKASANITSDSLHYPGYLVAHLVYGYGIIFFVMFFLIIIVKLFFYLPGAFQTSAQIFLPLVILFSFKFIFLKYIIRAVFLRDDSQRITNLAPYYIISYFNFFFDCFLGLLACISRVWQTTVVSLIRLPRLDKSMFNVNDEFLMRRLDKGHLAYLNYVRMEHWYNNPVLNGFCEMIIESMLYSQIYRKKYTLLANISMSRQTSSSGSNLVIKRLLSNNKNKIDKNSVLVKMVPLFAPKPLSKRVTFSLNDEQQQQNEIDDVIDMLPRMNTEEEFEEKEKVEDELKQFNMDFKYESFLRLRNILYLCLLLEKNPSLRQYRHHYLVALKQKELEAKKVRTECRVVPSFLVKNTKSLRRKWDIS